MLTIGLLSTLIGPYQTLGEDGVRGAKLALQEFGGQAGGHDIQFDVHATNALASSATDAVSQLVREGTKIIVGPLSGDEAIAVRDFATHHPEVTFVNGAAASQPMFNPAPNFFMFNATGAQVMTGLGRYCYEQLGYRRVATVGEAYSFPFAQIGGFSLDFSNAGGQIVDRQWCALGTQDYTQIIDAIPADVDAVYSTLGGTDGIHFLAQFREMRGDVPLIAGSIFGDQSLLSQIPADYADLLGGVVTASYLPDDIDTAEGVAFIDAYRDAYGKDGFQGPSFFAFAYYVATKAILLTLEAVDGDLTQLQDVLRTLSFETPAGMVSLDHNRVAVIDTFINEIRVTDGGHLYTHMLQRVPQTTATFGMADEEYEKIGRFNVHHMPGTQQETFADRIRKAKLVQ